MEECIKNGGALTLFVCGIFRHTLLTMERLIYFSNYVVQKSVRNKWFKQTHCSQNVFCDSFREMLCNCTIKRGILNQ